MYHQSRFDQKMSQQEIESSDIPIRSSNVDEQQWKKPDNTKCYLTVDPDIVDQKYFVVSFVAPIELEKKKKSFLFNHFMRAEINKLISDTSVHLLSKTKTTHDDVFEPYINKYTKSKNSNDQVIGEQLDAIRKEMKDKINDSDFGMECVHQYGMELEDVMVRFEEFVNNQEEGIELVERFDQEHRGQTSTTGFKVRGSYKYREQADERAKFLSEEVEPHIDCYVAPVGTWIPYNPYPDAIEGKYQVQELDGLMKKKQVSQQQAKQEFIRRKEEMKSDADQSTKEKKRQELKDKLHQKYAGAKGQRKTKQW